MNDGQSDDATEQQYFTICLTCGRLKNIELFEEGDCTCNDCYDEGRGGVNYELHDNGYFVEADA